MYMSISRHQIAEENRNIKVDIGGFEIVAKFRYMGVTITN